MRSAQRIYLDHAATTPTHPEVLAAMAPYFAEEFGNPSNPHSFSRAARAAVDEARVQVAQLIGAQPDEIVFTSGGTEADNFALIGGALRWRDRGNHLITSSIEHHAILHTCQFLEKNLGFRVTYLPVDRFGFVSPDDVAAAMDDETVLVSVMLANNEVGTIEPIADIARAVKERGVLFHTDAVQAVGATPVDVNELGVDLLSMSAHKCYGPKGVGALYLRRGARMLPFMHGGEQERGRRAGTENVPGIVGMGKSAEMARREEGGQGGRGADVAALRDRLVRGIRGRIDGVRLNGHPTQRLPNNVHICIEGVDGEAALLNLDLAGIAASTGSACTSGALEPSHVLAAMGIPRALARGALRLTLGRGNTEEDTDYAVNELAAIVERLRRVRKN